MKKSPSSSSVTLPAGNIPGDTREEDEKMHLALITGFYGSGKTSLILRVLRKLFSSDRHVFKIGVLLYSLPSDTADLSFLTSEFKHVSRERLLIAHREVATGGELRDALVEDLAELAAEGVDYLLVEAMAEAHPLRLAETLTFVDKKSRRRLNQFIQLDVLLNVIDAVNFGDYLLRDNKEKSEIRRGVIQQQIKFSQVVVVNKMDGLGPEKRNTLTRIIQTINPQAKTLYTEHGEIALRDFMRQQLSTLEALTAIYPTDWLSGEAYNPISYCEAFKYTTNRPFNPQKLAKVIQSHAFTSTENIVRGKGLLWLSTRKTQIGLWQQCRAALSLEGGERWSSYSEQPRQELVFIGPKAKEKETTVARLLEACLSKDTDPSVVEDTLQPWKPPSSHSTPTTSALPKATSAPLRRQDKEEVPQVEERRASAIQQQPQRSPLSMSLPFERSQQAEEPSIYFDGGAEATQFAAQLRQYGEKLLVQCKELGSFLEERRKEWYESNTDEEEEEAEDQLLEMAKTLAMETSLLVDKVVTPFVVKNTKNGTFELIREDPMMLRKAAASLREAIVALIRATKQTFSNPFDFMSQQQLAQSQRNVENRLKVLWSIAESLKCSLMAISSSQSSSRRTSPSPSPSSSPPTTRKNSSSSQQEQHVPARRRLSSVEGEDAPMKNIDVIVEMKNAAKSLKEMENMIQQQGTFLANVVGQFASAAKDCVRHCKNLVEYATKFSLEEERVQLSESVSELVIQSQNVLMNPREGGDKSELSLALSNTAKSLKLLAMAVTETQRHDKEQFQLRKRGLSHGRLNAFLPFPASPSTTIEGNESSDDVPDRKTKEQDKTTTQEEPHTNELLEADQALDELRKALEDKQQPTQADDAPSPPTSPSQEKEDTKKQQQAQPPKKQSPRKPPAETLRIRAGSKEDLDAILSPQFAASSPVVNLAEAQERRRSKRLSLPVGDPLQTRPMGLSPPPVPQRSSKPPPTRSISSTLSQSTGAVSAVAAALERQSHTVRLRPAKGDELRKLIASRGQQYDPESAASAPTNTTTSSSTTTADEDVARYSQISAEEAESSAVLEQIAAMSTWTEWKATLRKQPGNGSFPGGGRDSLNSRMRIGNKSSSMFFRELLEAPVSSTGESEKKAVEKSFEQLMREHNSKSISSSLNQAINAFIVVANEYAFACSFEQEEDHPSLVSSAKEPNGGEEEESDGFDISRSTVAKAEETSDAVKEVHLQLKVLLTMSLGKVGKLPGDASALEAINKVLKDVMLKLDGYPKRGKRDQHIRKVVLDAYNLHSIKKLNQAPSSEGRMLKSLQKQIYECCDTIFSLLLQALSTIPSLKVEEASTDADAIVPAALYLASIFTTLCNNMTTLLGLVETTRWIYWNRQRQHRLQKRRQAAAASSTSSSGGRSAKDQQRLSTTLKVLSELRDNINIWDEGPSNSSNFRRPSSDKSAASSNEIFAGTLNKLVELLTSATEIDNHYLATFITTYQSFASPRQLFEKLLQRYSVPPGHTSKEKTHAIQLRVCIVLKYWVEKQFFDFDDELLNTIFEFIDNQLKVDNQQLAKMLSSELKTRMNERTNREKAMFAQPRQLQALSVENLSTLFLTAKASDIAEQLTLVEFGTFAKIEPSELLNEAWSKDKLLHRCPNVLAMMQSANNLSYWVADLIVIQHNPKHRKKIFEKMISVAERLKKLNNFHSLMGILAGLSTSSINRLAITKKSVGNKYTKMWNKLSELMDVDQAGTKYREYFRSVRAPCVPFLGTYLKDLIFIEEGNKDKVDDDLINFTKREQVYGVIEAVQTYQHTPYKIEPVEPLHSFIKVLPYLVEKNLYDLSLMREPRQPRKT
ncbi:putative Ras guanine nucleotide exchange factor [Balamuthia mandrillaris]